MFSGISPQRHGLALPLFVDRCVTVGCPGCHRDHGFATHIGGESWM